MAQINRNQTIDLVRVIAAYGVVAIHVANSTPSAESLGSFFSIFCVPFFYVAALTYFIIGLKAPYSLNSILTKLWWRLVVPYLIWTVIYFLLLVSKKWMVGEPMNFDYWKIIFYGNSAVQLYFLPQIMMMQLLITVVFLITTMSVIKVFQAIGVLAVVISFLLIGYANNYFGVTAPIPILIYTLGAFLVASALKNKTSHFPYIIGGIVICILCLTIAFVKASFNNSSLLPFLPAAGIGLVLVAVFTNIQKLPKIFLSLAGISFGIYLSHVVFLEMFELVVTKIWKDGITYNFGTKASIALLLFTLSALFCLFINRFALLRKLLLGKSI